MEFTTKGERIVAFRIREKDLDTERAVLRALHASLISTITLSPRLSFPETRRITRPIITLRRTGIVYTAQSILLSGILPLDHPPLY